MTGVQCDQLLGTNLWVKRLDSQTFKTFYGNEIDKKVTCKSKTEKTQEKSEKQDVVDVGIKGVEVCLNSRKYFLQKFFPISVTSNSLTWKFFF